MNDQQRTTLAVAGLVHEQVLAQEVYRLGTLASDPRQIRQAMEHYLALCRKAGKAHRRKWFAAAKAMAQQAQGALEDLHYEIEAHRRQPHEDHQPPASLGDLVRDLNQLETEFDGWKADEGAATLSVQTESIELEGVYLGAFTIRLNLRELGRSDPVMAFNVIAQDPNSAGGRDGVTHPHVNDERLCAGDAVGPIRNALRAGRICDFFLLVRSVLQTYNVHSAYVQLESWNGTPCHDCGHLMDGDEGASCEYCGELFCDSCVSYCNHCNNTGCLSCLETCPACEERFCSNCMSTCNDCKQTCCVGCLADGLCPNCQDNKENDDEPNEPDATAAGPTVAAEQAA
jgi:hypothetical protein